MKKKLLKKYKQFRLRLFELDNLKNLSEKAKLSFFYKRGMYLSVLNRKVKKPNKDILIYYIVSNMAVGNKKKAEKLFYLLKKKKKLRRKDIRELLFKSYEFKCEKIIFELKKLVKDKCLKLSLDYYYCFYKRENNNQSNNFFKNYKKCKDIELIISNCKYSINDLEKIKILNKYLNKFFLKPLTIQKNKKFCIDNLKAENFIKKNNKQSFSVIMPVYNAEKFIEYSINSILNQTYNNFELIIVDDNSTDSTVNIIREKFLNKNLNIKLVKLNQNAGPYIAKNIGIQLSKYEIITFHDADDFSHPQKFELQLESLMSNNKIASISYWVRIDDNGQYYSRHVYPLLRVNMSSLMIKKEIIKKIGFFDSVKTGADSEYFHRIIKYFGEERIERIKKPLTLGAHHLKSLMNNEKTGYKEGVSLMRLEYWEAWNKWHLENNDLFIDFPLKERKFYCPMKNLIEVDFNNLLKTIEVEE